MNIFTKFLFNLFIGLSFYISNFFSINGDEAKYNYNVLNHIDIPKINIKAPIIEISDEIVREENWIKLEKAVQKGLNDGVVHYPYTANPGQIGNVFITGHSAYYFWDKGDFKTIFLGLHNLEIGDKFYIHWKNKKYTYEIYEIKIISPKETSVLEQPSDKKITTLMTSTPPGTSKNRLIIIGKQL